MRAILSQVGAVFITALFLGLFVSSVARADGTVNGAVPDPCVAAGTCQQGANLQTIWYIKWQISPYPYQWRYATLADYQEACQEDSSGFTQYGPPWKYDGMTCVISPDNPVTVESTISWVQKFEDDADPNQIAYMTNQDLDGWVASLICPSGDIPYFPNGNLSPPTCGMSQCASMVGQTTTLYRQCGIASCPVGYSLQALGNGLAGLCSNGSAPVTMSSAAPSPLNLNGCEAVYQRLLSIKVPSTAAGQTAPVTCGEQYAYNGVTADGEESTPGQNGQSPTDPGGIPLGTAGSNDPNCPNSIAASGQSYCIGPSNPSSSGSNPSSGAGSGSGSGSGDGSGDGTAGSGDGTSGSGVAASGNGTADSGTGGCGPGVAYYNGVNCPASSAGSSAGSGNGSATAAKDCNNPPQCTGDAVNCAILNQDWTDTCMALATPSSNDQQWAAGIATSAASDYNTANTNYSTGFQSVVSGWLSDSSNSKYAGSCFTDAQFNVMGGTLTLPFSKICPFLLIIKGVLMTIGVIIGARIVFGAAL